MLAEINQLVDQAISGAAIRAPVSTGNDLQQLLDLSKIDFDELSQLFAQGSKKSVVEIVRGKAETKAPDLAARNPSASGCKRSCKH